MEELRDKTMIPLDYGRSFLIGNGPENEVRFWVESRTRILDEEGNSEEFIQTASCKSENTFAECGLFRQDNYDFLPIFGPEYGVVFRRKARVDTGYKSCLPSADMWNGQKYHLVEGERVEELRDNEAIREATCRFAPIVSQTRISSQETGLRAIIECPIKTMNTNRERDVYQVDTGPVAFPDLGGGHARHVDRISLAFLAFNAPDFTDFVIETPTLVGEGERAGETHHYSRLMSLQAENRLFSVE